MHTALNSTMLEHYVEQHGLPYITTDLDGFPTGFFYPQTEAEFEQAESHDLRRVTSLDEAQGMIRMYNIKKAKSALNKLGERVWIDLPNPNGRFPAAANDNMADNFWMGFRYKLNGDLQPVAITDMVNNEPMFGDQQVDFVAYWKR